MKYRKTILGTLLTVGALIAPVSTKAQMPLGMRIQTVNSLSDDEEIDETSMQKLAEAVAGVFKENNSPKSEQITKSVSPQQPIQVMKQHFVPIDRKISEKEKQEIEKALRSFFILGCIGCAGSVAFSFVVCYWPELKRFSKNFLQKCR
ncbi:MAG: hypothetical protein J6Y47_05845 [Bacteroidales bacterium]|nr:hypothetical protein [Bacteroidales bacterium]